jgi:hypothetical protein
VGVKINSKALLVSIRHTTKMNESG